MTTQPYRLPFSNETAQLCGFPTRKALYMAMRRGNLPPGSYQQVGGSIPRVGSKKNVGGERDDEKGKGTQRLTKPRKTTSTLPRYYPT